MKITVRTLFVLLFVLPGFLSSCSVLWRDAASEQEIEYVRGELQSKFNRPLAETWAGAQAAIEGSGLAIKSKRADSFSAVLKAEDAQARTIEITAEKVEESLTLVKIRVGLLGDAEFSKQLMDLVAAKLKH